jgi:acylphosphatase
MVDESKARLHAIVTGRVQGVGFRMFVSDTAISHILCGWVRNRWDDSVELTVEGNQQALEQLLQALHEGPPMARVDDVKYEWQSYANEFIGFRVKHTG